MKHVKKMIILLLASYMFIGCAARHIKKERDLRKHEGVFITKLHTNVKKYNLLFYSTGWEKSPKAYVLARSLESLHVIPITANKTYYLGRMMTYYCAANIENRYFDIKPGTVTYIGDIYLHWNQNMPPICGSITTRIVDNEEETIAEAKEQYPLLFKNYQYEKNIPVLEIETVEGFEEVEELKQLKKEKKEENDKQKEQKE